MPHSQGVQGTPQRNGIEGREPRSRERPFSQRGQDRLDFLRALGAGERRAFGHEVGVTLEDLHHLVGFEQCAQTIGALDHWRVRRCWLAERDRKELHLGLQVELGAAGRGVVEVRLGEPALLGEELHRRRNGLHSRFVGHRPQRERDAVEASPRAVEEVEDLDRDAAVAQRLRERRAGVPHEPVEAVAAHQTMFTRRPLKVMLCTLALSTPLLILQSLMSPTQL